MVNNIIMATKDFQYNTPIAFHPGETLAEKLQEMGMSIKEFAVRTNKPEKTIIAVIKGKSSLTPDMAVSFENVTKIPARMWMNLQRTYDEYVARNKYMNSVVRSIDWAKQFPIPSMIKNGWIQPCRKPEEKANIMLSFFGVSSPAAWNCYYMEKQLKVAFRISLASTKDPYAVSAWLRQGEIQASNMDISIKFTVDTLEKKIPLMKTLMIKHPKNMAAELQSVCKDAGIKLIYTQPLPKAPINGATRWINDVPCIQLSGRYNRYDIFWFSFFHEMGHIILHGKKDVFLENIEYTDKQKEKETEADNYASNILLTKSQEKVIIESKDYSQKSIVSFANKFGTHPAVIVGRLQHLEVIDYWDDAKLREKINLFEEN
jgi:HTH-type transcriptional regulator/antitoxin HigA